MKKVGRDRDGVDDDGAVEKWCLATPLASNARNDDGGDMAMAGGCVGVVNAGGVTANNVIGRGWLPETGGALPRPPSCGWENTRSHCRRPGGEIGQCSGMRKCCPHATASRYLLQRNSKIPNFCLPGVEIEVGIMTELATSSLVGGGASF